MGMGNIRSLAANLSVLFFLVASGASRVLLDHGKVSPSPLPTPVPSPKRNNSESSQIAPQNPNKLINQYGSNYPPLPSKPVNNYVEKEEENACKSSSTKCQREKLIACLKHSEEDSKNLSLVVQNTGEDDLTVKIRGQPSLHLKSDNVTLSRNSSKQINLPVNDWNVTEIILEAGTGNCTFQVAVPTSDWNFFQPFLGYDFRLNPIFGLYLLVLTVVIIGAIWACRRFRNRRNRDGSRVPYQQLEMGEQPRSTSIVDSNTADGWDDWDDDWDDEAARPSDKHATASISSNGLTSRTPKKDDWDKSWDD